MKKEKFSIIIPTMQKNINILNMLVAELVEDDTIGEIIIIDNSLKGYNYNSDKIRIIVPKKNLYVNPSWNLGVKKAKFDYIGILNDDILIPKNLCKQVLDKLINDNTIGLIGLDAEIANTTTIENMNEYPPNKKIILKPITNTYKTWFWGTAIFGNKKNYHQIPKMQIWCGDNFLLFKNLKNSKNCYQLSQCNIKHLGSNTINKTPVNDILKSDIYYYAHIDKKYRKHELFESRFKIFIQNVFSVRNSSDKRHKIITIFGIKFKFKTNKKIILYIDWHIFEPDTNAGDRASYSYLKALANNNYIIKYLPEAIEINTKPEYFDLLNDIGVEALLNDEKQIDMDYIKSWLQYNGNLIDYVFINRPTAFQKYEKLIYEYAKQAKIMFQGHDIHHIRLQRMAKVDKTNIELIQQKEYLEKLEKDIWNKADTILYFSDQEIKLIKEQIPNAKTMAVPLFLYSDFEKINYIPEKRKNLLFVGGFNHSPNADAMRWFIKDIFPIITKTNSDIKLNIVGSNCPQDIIELARNNNNIIIHGYLSDEDLNNLYLDTKIVISPLRYGAGVKGKIIEAMKNQIPIVTTSIGAEGINTNLLTIADEENDFANTITNLYSNNSKLIEISKESYDFIKENFSDKFITKLMEFVDEQ